MKIDCLPLEKTQLATLFQQVPYRIDFFQQALCRLRHLQCKLLWLPIAVERSTTAHRVTRARTRFRTSCGSRRYRTFRCRRIRILSILDHHVIGLQLQAVGDFLRSNVRSCIKQIKQRLAAVEIDVNRQIGVKGEIRIERAVAGLFNYVVNQLLFEDGIWAECVRFHRLTGTVPR